MSRAESNRVLSMAEAEAEISHTSVESNCCCWCSKFDPIRFDSIRVDSTGFDVIVLDEYGDASNAMRPGTENYNEIK